MRASEEAIRQLQEEEQRLVQSLEHQAQQDEKLARKIVSEESPKVDDSICHVHAYSCSDFETLNFLNFCRLHLKKRGFHNQVCQENPNQVQVQTQLKAKRKAKEVMAAAH